jgi:hypothetical protein
MGTLAQLLAASLVDFVETNGEVNPSNLDDAVDQLAADVAAWLGHVTPDLYREDVKS